MKRKSILIILLILIPLLALSAEDFYDTSSQVFTITAGVDLPFTNSYKKDDGTFTTGLWWGEDGTHFNIGGYGSIDYEVFLNSKISIGGEVGYQFNRCTNERLFTQVPPLQSNIRSSPGKIRTPDFTRSRF